MWNISLYIGAARPCEGSLGGVVKQLAGTTAASISDIEARIEAIQNASREGVAALERIEGLVEKLNESQHTVAAAIEEQSAVTSNIASAITTMSEGASTSATQSEEIVSSVDAVGDQIDALHRIIAES